MGKSLIIKGVDFSINAIESVIEWYNEYSTIQGTVPLSSSSYVFLAPRLSAIPNLGIFNKPINYVKLYSIKDDVINIGLMEITSEDGVTPVTYNIESQHEYNIAEGENTIFLNEPITINDYTHTIFFSPVVQNLTLNRNDIGFLPVSATTYPQTNKLAIQFGYKHLV